MFFPATDSSVPRPVGTSMRTVRGPGEIRRDRHGFTLLEMMVSFAVLSILVVLIATMIDSTAQATRRTVDQAQTFQEARNAFELLTRRLSQATLNTYWDYDDPNNPTQYKRQSELHFVIGRTSDELSTSANTTPAFGVFFQAPLGKGNNDSLRSLSNLLNNCGFFVRFDSNTGSIPPVFPNSVSPTGKYRFRLYQWVEPSREMKTLQPVTGTNADKLWFRTPLSGNQPGLRPIAENIIALIIHPRLSAQEDPDGTAVSSDFSYDSRQGPITRMTYNQLPPSLEITMVAIDETSATRLAAENGSSPPDFGISELFKSTNADDIRRDLEKLEETLQGKNLNYRMFRTTVKIPSAKWSGY